MFCGPGDLPGSQASLAGETPGQALGLGVNISWSHLPLLKAPPSCRRLPRSPPPHLTREAHLGRSFNCAIQHHASEKGGIILPLETQEETHHTLGLGARTKGLLLDFAHLAGSLCHTHTLCPWSSVCQAHGLGQKANGRAVCRAVAREDGKLVPKTDQPPW